MDKAINIKKDLNGKLYVDADASGIPEKDGLRLVAEFKPGSKAAKLLGEKIDLPIVSIEKMKQRRIDYEEFVKKHPKKKEKYHNSSVISIVDGKRAFSSNPDDFDFDEDYLSRDLRKHLINPEVFKTKEYEDWLKRRKAEGDKN